MTMIIREAKFAGSSTRVSEKPERKLPEFAFIGRSNVGKSSLINMLCGKKNLAMTSSTPGKTKLVNHFLINDTWYLVDLPGYGYSKMSKKARVELYAILRDYLNNSAEMVMVFVLVDCRHKPQKADLDFLAELGEHGVPFAMIFTKGDKLGPVALDRKIREYGRELSKEWEVLPLSFKSSSQTKLGRGDILNYIENVLRTLDSDMKSDFKNGTADGGTAVGETE